MRTINAEIQICDQTIRKNQTERDQLLMRKGGFEKDATRADTERRNLTLLDENNKKIEIYKAYAEKIYEELQDVYISSEAEIRSKLEATINEIFRTIYEGGLSLTIDEKYHISVYADDYDGDVETSTAQSISVIFAFITGIIKMARENRTANNEDAALMLRVFRLLPLYHRDLFQYQITHTLPLFTFLNAAVVNIFVPSA